MYRPCILGSFSIFIVCKLNTFFVWFYNKGQAAAVGLEWLSVACEKCYFISVAQHCKKFGYLGMLYSVVNKYCASLSPLVASV